jgi:O-methyltransferase involved in polyketide biosynthesis
MTLLARLRWIEADYPHIIEYKESLLADKHPRCRLERVKIDLARGAARRDFFAGVNARSGGILVLTEGVVPFCRLREARTRRRPGSVQVEGSTPHRSGKLRNMEAK